MKAILIIIVGVLIGVSVGFALDKAAAKPAESGAYTEADIVAILAKAFSDWDGDQSERLIFIAANGKIIDVAKGDDNRISIPMIDIIRQLARAGQRMATITNVIHPHKRSLDFSPDDKAFAAVLAKYGFRGAFQVFYPETRRIKTLKGE